PVSRPTGLRHFGRGHFRVRVHEWVCGPRASAAADLPGRYDSRALWSNWSSGGAAAYRDGVWKGTGDRYSFARSALCDSWSAGGELQGYADGEAADGEPVDEQRSAQCLCDQGRQMGLPLRFNAEHGGTAVLRDWKAGTRGRHTLF